MSQTPPDQRPSGDSASVVDSSPEPSSSDRLLLEVQGERDLLRSELHVLKRDFESLSHRSSQRIDKLEKDLAASSSSSPSTSSFLLTTAPTTTTTTPTAPLETPTTTTTTDGKKEIALTDLTTLQTMASRFHLLQETKHQLKRDLVVLEEQNRSLRNQNRLLSAENEMLNGALESEEVKLRRVKRNGGVESFCEKAEIVITNLRKEVVGLQCEVGVSQKEIDGLKNLITEKDECIQQLEGKCTQFLLEEEQIKKNEITQSQNIRKLEVKIRELEEKCVGVPELRKKASMLQLQVDEATQAQDRVGVLEKQLGEASISAAKKIGELESQLSQLAQSHTRVKQELGEASTERDALLPKVAQLELQLQNVQKEHQDAAAATISEKEASIAKALELEPKLALLTKAKAQLELQVQTLQKERQAAAATISEKEASIAKALELEPKVALLAKAKAQLELQLETLQKEHQEAAATILEKEASIAQLQTEAGEVHQLVESQTAELKLQQQTLVEELKLSFEEEKKHLAETIETLQTQLLAVREAIPVPLSPTQSRPSPAAAATAPAPAVTRKKASSRTRKRKRRNEGPTERHDPERKRPAKRRRTSSVGVLFTGFGTGGAGAFDRAYLRRLKDAVEGLGGRVCQSRRKRSSGRVTVIPTGATHVVGVPGVRTMKLLAATLMNRWVVHPRWLEDSLAEGRFLPEDNYGCQRSNCLTSKTVFVSDRLKKKAEAQFSQIKELVQHAKTRMATSSRRADFVVLYEAGDKKKYRPPTRSRRSSRSSKSPQLLLFDELCEMILPQAWGDEVVANLERMDTGAESVSSSGVSDADGDVQMEDD